MRLTGWLLLLLPYVVAGCSGGGQSGCSTEPDTSVVSVAYIDAARIVECGDLRDMEGVLLEVRAKESLMRANGLDATAELYIATFEDIICRKAPALAAEIGI